VQLPGLLKQAATPGSVGFAIVCAIVWLALMLLTRRSIALAWLLAVVGAHLALSLPAVAVQFAARLPPRDAIQMKQDHVDTLIVFDGDNRRGRVRTSVQAYGVLHPRYVIVLGEVWLLNALVAAGMPADRILRDEAPATTREQVAWMARRTLSHPGESVVVVASCLQTPRIAGLIDSAGINAGLFPSPVDEAPVLTGVRRFVPSYLALRISRDAAYEHAAVAYYRWRGWIAASVEFSGASVPLAVMPEACNP
jgi:uncharacterized SAM-binding protein YcdF (DUF218 family)